MSHTAQHPSTEAVLAAYQVTMQHFTSEQQLIWNRTGFFAVLNALVIQALFTLNDGKPLSLVVVCVVTLIAFLYSIFWLFSMFRAWDWHDFLFAMLREQEQELQLQNLGSFTRGLELSKRERRSVAGKPMKFTKVGGIASARWVTIIAILLFILAYLLIFVFTALMALLNNSPYALAF